jgi:WASH complex subunit CCDC53
MALNSARMQTFFNEFLTTTTTFLNQFANECECKFFDFERKLNRIESNLVIIEAKVSYNFIKI